MLWLLFSSCENLLVHTVPVVPGPVGGVASNNESLAGVGQSHVVLRVDSKIRGQKFREVHARRQLAARLYWAPGRAKGGRSVSVPIECAASSIETAG